jgi:hypothetical protein
MCQTDDTGPVVWFCPQYDAVAVVLDEFGDYADTDVLATALAVFETCGVASWVKLADLQSLD